MQYKSVRPGDGEPPERHHHPSAADADAGTFYGEPTKQFTTADFSVGTSYANWTASLFIQNAFDKRGILSKNSECVPGICGQYARVYPIKPQYFGVRFGQKF